VWDWATLAGTVGVFIVAFALFMRLLPALSMTEGRQLAHERGGGGRR
jgi:molybdopterin-containing oxidoreductase family membrane subunit